jgi:ABC-type cobalamin/Fe3+-siderophores transport system ATPase subunit
MFTRIYADNYLCFVNFEFKPGPLNLLVGDNGSGKSALFRLLQSIRLVVRGIEVAKAFPRECLTRWETVRSVQRFEFEIRAPTGGVYLHALEIEHDRESGSVRLLREKIWLDGAPLATLDGELLLAGSSVPVALPYDLKGSLLSLKLREPSIDALRILWEAVGTFKLVPGQMESSATEEENWFSSDGSNFAAWYRSMVQEDPEVVEAARNSLREVIGGFRHLYLKGDNGRKELMVHFEAGKASSSLKYDLKLSELSDGQRVLIFLYSVVSGFSELPVLFFDEPDNFVSLREIQPWLMRLSEEVAKGGQAFLISHNPEVIDYLAADRVYLLERPGDGPARIKELLFDLEGGLKASEQLARGWTGGS